ncbi:hypothetical protein NL676_015784 [Syzygium grande]|nr:hypothetical protein NL676_015784 [Syzygium grande]
MRAWEGNPLSPCLAELIQLHIVLAAFASGGQLVPYGILPGDEEEHCQIAPPPRHPPLKIKSGNGIQSDLINERLRSHRQSLDPESKRRGELRAIGTRLPCGICRPPSRRARGATGGAISRRSTTGPDAAEPMALGVRGDDDGIGAWIGGDRRNFARVFEGRDWDRV